MFLDLERFNSLYQNKKLKIAFIGMSNIGKSYRSLQLYKEYDFFRYCVDDHICSALSLKSMNEMSEWMGQPHDEGFFEKQKIYLEKESLLTKKQIEVDNNIVYDTTGSVIYLNENCLSFLKNNFLIIYFQEQPEMIEAMISNYFLNPKPLIWGNSFKMLNNGNKTESLKKSYLELLKYRSDKYLSLCDIKISGKYTADDSISIDVIFDLIKENLK